jgi:pantetheine hydrolase
MLSHTHCVLFLLVKIATAYKAGVVEYNPLTADTPRNTILKNLNEYRSYADNSRTQAVDILVFPEYGLTTLVENPAEYAVEITDDNNNQIITELVAMAKERQMYLVVNLLEMVKEPNKETAYYNTNLVFGRNGTIIAKYRKINLYKEPNLTPGDANQRVTFRTDFGVTFGVFTCFDILFANPSSSRRWQRYL